MRRTLTSPVLRLSSSSSLRIRRPLPLDVEGEGKVTSISEFYRLRSGPKFWAVDFRPNSCRWGYPARSDVAYVLWTVVGVARPTNHIRFSKKKRYRDDLNLLRKIFTSSKKIKIFTCTFFKKYVFFHGLFFFKKKTYLYGPKTKISSFYSYPSNSSHGWC